MRELTIAVAQAESASGRTDANLELLQELVNESKSKGAGLLCLPEAYLTGYNRHRARDIAIAADDPRLRRVERIARETGVAISYGYIEQNPQGERPFVTHVVTNGTERLVYHKTHLGPHEQAFFTPGEHLPTKTIAGVCVGVHLCWEGHIPQIAATLRKRGAELLIAPFASGLGGNRRRDAWMRCLPARANDNGCFLAACNALRPVNDESAQTQASLNAVAGSKRAGVTGGGAIIFNPKGEVIAERFSHQNDLVITTLNGPLPRESSEERMGSLSYFDHQRPKLYE